jgi:methyl-accepting chemotaxis protein
VLKKIKVSGKFLIITAVLSLVLLGGITVAVVWTARDSHNQQGQALIGLLQAEQKQEQKLLKESLLLKGKSLATLLAQIGASFVIGYDFDTLQQIAANAAKDPDVAYVTFYNKEGKALTKEFKGSFQGEVVKHPVKFEKKALGEVRIGLSFAWIDKNIKAISGRIQKMTEQTQRSTDEAVNSMVMQTAIYSIITVVILCIAIYWSLSRFVVKPVKTISEGLSMGAQQVAVASSEVSRSSQSLAQGASEQAASLEETTASLEEMGSVTRQTAENAGQADGMMNQAGQIVAKANESMQKLRAAMEKINAASDETAKIIKTIDEIAFQTNLLALNAAVEAARAGEAGAGFAVVADEVRNLAMRAAEAAKNTATLIEENIKDIQTGSELVVATDEAFGQVQKSASKVGELVTEIATASQEQAEGIKHVGTAMTEMDRVTQQTAASAQQSAASAEELSAQSETMRGLVQDLVGLLGAKAAKRKERKSLKVPNQKQPVQLDYQPKRGSQKAPEAAQATANKVKAEEAIPMAEEEFKDF